jgi:hypothetical protein
LNDDDVLESRHSLELSENVLDELLDDSINDSFDEDHSSRLNSLDFSTSANFTSDR